MGRFLDEVPARPNTPRGRFLDEDPQPQKNRTGSLIANAVIPGSPMLKPIMNAYEVVKKPLVDFSTNAPGPINLLKNIPEVNIESPLARFTPQPIRNAIFPRVPLTGPKAAEAVAGTGVDIAAMGGLEAGLPKLLKGGEVALQAVKKTPRSIGRLPDKILRGGVTREEATRLGEQYGTSNASLIDSVKGKLKENIKTAEDNFTKILDEVPLSKRARLNNFRAELTNTLEGLFRGGRLRKDIPEKDLKPIRDLIDMYGDKREVFDKTEFLRRRSRLVDLQQSPNGEIAAKATRLKDALETDAEEFGYGPIREAKRSYAVAKQKEGQFLNKNTGDIKVATEARLSRLGTKKKLSGQELQHINELGQYVNIPLSDEARAINRINQASDRWKTVKKRLAQGAIGLAGLGGAKNLFSS